MTHSQIYYIFMKGEKLNNGFQEFGLVFKKFGQNLKKARLIAGMTQEFLAEKANLDSTYISKMERGVKNPTLLTMLTLSKVLNISPKTLIDFN